MLTQIHDHQGNNEDTPDEVYAKYISIVVVLPDDAKIWSITLCSKSVSTLITNLKENME